MSEEVLPVHGFVLAGGKSSRMGVDKATLEFCGRPLVEIAVEKLRGFCADVSICGNRDDLARFAPVVREARVECGPAAGIEAGLMAARQEWCLFLPVDVPLIPGELLRRWARSMVLAGPLELGVSNLSKGGERQPAFCMVRRDRAPKVSEALDKGARRLSYLFAFVEDDAGDSCYRTARAAEFQDVTPSNVDLDFWFQNLNTAAEFDEAELWAQTLRG